MPTFRPAGPEDLHSLAAWESGQDTSPWLCETGHTWHRHALADPGQEHLIAVDEAGPVGFAVLAGLGEGRAVEPRRMVVLAARRGQGQGRALPQAALDRAYRRHGARTVRLEVKSHNHRARALYESAGFVATETRRNAVAEPDGTTSDLVVMIHGPA